MFGDAFKGKTVWLSGVTGFKGTWLAEWLVSLGAKVHGFALAPSTNPSVFGQTGLSSRITWDEADLRDAAAVRRSLLQAKPDFVLHLAAQPLVRLSYAEPVDTYATNVMGTIHVLEALRALDRPCAAVLVTTDKCYENRERDHRYGEEDHLGGHDPYSSSKAACEIAIASWRRSFFQNHPVKIASARAGNVIGGGDWALDRIMPDCVRSLGRSEAIALRHPGATRPWQHVLEPLSGYLWLAACLANPRLRPPGAELCAAFNFGPGPEANRTVAELVTEVLQTWPGSWVDKSDPKAVHEAKLLQLDTAKAKALLDWSPVWLFSDAVRETMAWYRANPAGLDAGQVHAFTLQQIKSYGERAAAGRAPWTA
ncbi:MAG: CDP-glucose 4,6-dehydratase [Lacunisphaera sp.]|nr:CDP-glucose 4,6-dehydratase [Lacunisphaera sp.]